MIAQGNFPISKVEKAGSMNEWIPLNYKGKDAG